MVAMVTLYTQLHIFQVKNCKIGDKYSIIFIGTAETQQTIEPKWTKSNQNGIDFML